MADKARIHDIASRVAAGERVDWVAENAAGAGSTVLRNLQVLEALSQSLEAQSKGQDPAGLVRHLNETFDAWLAVHAGEDSTVPTSWGRLRIDGLHGSGARADVYRAWDPRLERAVALKLFRTAEPELQERLLAEGRKLAQVDHPNVVRILEAETHDGRVGLLMESVQGRNLEDRVAEEGPMGADEARSVGLTLCRALAAVHAAGVLHRDIKAQNVLRQQGGRVVLADLGSAVEQVAAGQSTLSGTPLYLAPEILSSAPPSVRSDVYALGVLLFFLVTGRYPVEANSLDELSSLHREASRQHLHDLRPDLGEHLAGVIGRALAADPADRFGSMGEMAAALSASAVIEPGPSPRKRGWLAATLLAAFFLVWVGWKHDRAPGESPVPAVQGGYQVDAVLYRQHDGGIEVLSDGQRVRVGDRIGLSVAADTDLHVYVFNVDQGGNAFALFPLAASGLGNPLAAGRAHWLPGERGGGTLSWVVDRAGGAEEIHVVASPEPLVQIEQMYDDLPLAQLANSALGARGMGTISVGPAQPPVSATPLLQAVRAASSGEQRIQGTWHRVFVLAGDEG